MDIQPFLAFCTVAVMALAVENAVFARALGVSRNLLFLPGARSALLHGALLTWMAVLSTLMVAPVNYFVADSPYVAFIRAPLFFLCVAVSYTATVFAARYLLKAHYAEIMNILPLSTFNTALFGIFFVIANNDYGMLLAMGYALGSGVGYTISLLVVYFARKRLAISPVPKSFRGLPVLLVYIGLLSLAIYGLIGYGLSA